MFQSNFAVDDIKSRAARCAELALSAKNDKAREYWQRMEQLWRLKAQQAELEAAPEHEDNPQDNAIMVEV